ncbi:MAG TPA: histidine phosphatase family protein [Kofleriaceae bacterium]|jgi:probable phosphoglycerate mutase
MEQCYLAQANRRYSDAMSSRRLLLARHGQTAWNALGKLQGHTDIALDDTGREQARALAEQLRTAGVGTVWTSDLSRARETGEIVASVLGLGTPRVEPALRERKFGIFEGLTRAECAERHPEHWAAWQAQSSAPPGGEPIPDAVVRMNAALAKIALGAEAGAILVVSHGGLMRLWLQDLHGTHLPPIANGSIHAIEHDGERFRVG